MRILGNWSVSDGDSWQNEVPSLFRVNCSTDRWKCSAPLQCEFPIDLLLQWILYGCFRRKAGKNCSHCFVQVWYPGSAIGFEVSVSRDKARKNGTMMVNKCYVYIKLVLPRHGTFKIDQNMSMSFSMEQGVLTAAHMINEPPVWIMMIPWKTLEKVVLLVCNAIQL